jgi:hypothetical protein
MYQPKLGVVVVTITLDFLDGYMGSSYVSAVLIIAPQPINLLLQILHVLLNTIN